MRTEGQRRSSNFGDRGSSRGSGGGVPIQALTGSGNSSQEIPLSEMNAYIKDRFNS